MAGEGKGGKEDVHIVEVEAPAESEERNIFNLILSLLA